MSFLDFVVEALLFAALEVSTNIAENGHGASI
jgi:hypothetical protein